MPVFQMNHWSSAQRNHIVQSGRKPRTFNSKSSILSDSSSVSLLITLMVRMVLMVYSIQVLSCLLHKLILSFIRLKF